MALRPDFAAAYQNLGTALRGLGKLDEAIAALTQAVRLQPAWPEAQNILGLTFADLGKRDEAMVHHRLALQANQSDAAAHFHLGRALAGQGLLEEAATHLRQALQIDPQFAAAHRHLGHVQMDSGRLDAAVSHYRQAVQLKTDFAEAYTDLGSALQLQGFLDEAVANHRQALRLKPEFAEAHTNLGGALLKQGNIKEALSHHREALRIKPDLAEAHGNLALALKELNQLDEAQAHARQALSLRPGYAPAHLNLGMILDRQGKFGEAEACFRESIRIKPINPEAFSNLGIALLRQNKLTEVGPCFDEALHVQPDFGTAHWNRSHLWLLSGDFKRGWPEYEWRWTQPTHAKRAFSQPRWEGSALDGKTILLHAEQGLGDTIQFIRYASLVADRGGNVVVECPPVLAPLVVGVRGVHRVVTQALALPPFDVQLPLLSVPGVMQTDLGTIPAAVPYLKVDGALVERWRREIGMPKRLGGRLRQVGIVWQGNPANPTDRQRSIPLSHFARLAQVEGVQLISLQKGPGTHQLAELRHKFPIVDLGSRLGDSAESLTNIAAVIESLDLVVACDTAIAHLAGALAVPVWLALAVVPDWRWLLGARIVLGTRPCVCFGKPALRNGKTCFRGWRRKLVSHDRIN